MDEQIVIKSIPAGAHADKLTVRANTVDQLFEESDIRDVQIVMIDTEGADVKLLKMLPFDKTSFRPTVVVFEHTEIQPREREEAADFLHKHCYMVASDWENTFAISM